MNLTQHPIQLRGAARLLPTTLAVVLIGSACTSALAFRQQIAAPEPQTNTDTTQTAALQPLVLAIPRSGQPERSYNLEIPDTPNNTSALPSGSYVLKVFPPKASSPKQANDEPTARIAAGVIAGQRTNFVEPVYPPEAKKAKLNGTVVLHAIIDKDGTIKTLNVLSSTNPMFNDSALDAVHKWTYKPYLLNGEPTAVDTNITVNYALAPSPEPEPSPAPSPSASKRQPSAPSPQLMHVGGDVKPPIVIHRVDPEYSREAHDAKFSGDVIVYLQVDTDGHTSHIRVKKGVGMGLDEKAVKAVSQYRFKPATLAGKPVPVDLYIDVNFQNS